MAEPSTVVDMTGTSPKLIRQGKVFIVSFDLCRSTSVNYWKTILTKEYVDTYVFSVNWGIQGPKLYWMEEEDANSTAIEDLIPSAT